MALKLLFIKYEVDDTHVCMYVWGERGVGYEEFP